MDIFKLVERVMAEDNHSAIGIKRAVSFYPSAAMSVDLTDPSKRIGACVRAEWYRCKRISKTNPTGSYSNYILSFGKHLEVWLIDQLKLSGVYVSSNDKFVFPGRPIISGEVDIIVKDDDGTYAVIENKTFSSGNYQALKKLAGSGGRSPAVPEPKIQNLMQSHIYLHALEGISSVYLTYLDRAAGGPEKNIQFKITNYKEDEGNYAKIHVSRPFGEFDFVNRQFTMESILDGYDNLLEYLKADVIPPPTYRISMSKEEADKDWDEGLLAKTKYELFCKNQEKYPIGDWQCAWCSYLNQCKVDQGIEITG